MIKTGLTILATLFSFAVLAEVLADIDCTSPNDIRRFRILRAGNYGKGPLAGAESLTFPLSVATIDGTEKYPILLYNGCNTGWDGIAVDFNPDELPASGTLRVTVWLKTNRPGSVTVMATEGARVGGGCIKKSLKSGSATEARQVVSTELGRFNPGDGFSFGCFINYGGGGAWLLVDRVLIEYIPDISAVGIERETASAGACEDYAVPTVTGPYAFLNDLMRPGKD